MKYYRYQCNCGKLFYLSYFTLDRDAYLCINCYYEALSRDYPFETKVLEYANRWLDNFKNKKVAKEIKLFLVARMI
jgi:hypothetical protein